MQNFRGTALTNPGDKVVIFSPFYENYGADTILTGAEPIYVPLTPPEFTFDPGYWRMPSANTRRR